MKYGILNWNELYIPEIYVIKIKTKNKKVMYDNMNKL